MLSAPCCSFIPQAASLNQLSSLHSNFHPPFLDSKILILKIFKLIYLLTVRAANQYYCYL